MSRRAVMIAEYGSAAGALLALAGPRAGAAARSLVAVNGAAIAALASGTVTGMALARRPPPVPADTTNWHALTGDAVLAQLRTSRGGLSEDEADRRRQEQPGGFEHAEPGVMGASVAELANPLTPALAAGAGPSALGGVDRRRGPDRHGHGDQRVHRRRSARGRGTRAGPAARGIGGAGPVAPRRAEALTIANQLVPGDVITVQAGDPVPADARILEAHGLETDESNLTGESHLVAKIAEPTVAANVADRRSMLYAGTVVAAGTGTAVVVAAGPATELGRSTQVAQQDHWPSGVKERLGQLTSITVPIALGAGGAVVVAGLVRGQPVGSALGTGVSLAVAAVPEGLPIVATLAQLSAARRLSRHNALVRNPGTLKALGRVDVLCFDKTGTLTEGRIRLHRVVVAGAEQPLDALR